MYLFYVYIYIENIAQMVPLYRSVGTARSGSVVPLISVWWYRYQSSDIHAVKGCRADGTSWHPKIASSSSLTCPFFYDAEFLPWVLYAQKSLPACPWWHRQVSVLQCSHTIFPAATEMLWWLTSSIWTDRNGEKHIQHSIIADSAFWPPTPQQQRHARQRVRLPYRQSDAPQNKSEDLPFWG